MKLVTKSYPKFRSFLKFSKIHSDSEKLNNSFKIKGWVTWLLNNIPELLSCKINVFEIVKTVNFFKFRYIAKYWNSDRIKLESSWKCTFKEFLNIINKLRDHLKVRNLLSVNKFNVIRQSALKFLADDFFLLVNL